MAARLCVMLYLLDENRKALAKKGENSKKRRQGRRIRSSNMISKDIDYIRNYSLSEDLINILETDLTPYLPVLRRSGGLPKRLKILCALSYLGNACYQKPIGKNMDIYVSQSSVSRALHQVVDALNHPDIIKKYIRFPQDASERENLTKRFYEQFHIPGVLGCVSGTLVTMVQPRHHKNRFYCCKGYHARNVLLITDADLNILHLDVMSGGATHDDNVFASSIIRQHLEDLCKNGEALSLLGDSGFAQRQYLMTPITEPTSGESPAEYYNNLHRTAHSTAEETIQILKSRFRCLLAQKVLQYDPTMVAKIVIACCVLHNMCNRAGHSAPALEQEELEEENRITTMLRSSRKEKVHGDLGGEASREQLVTKLWRERHS